MPYLQAFEKKIYIEHLNVSFMSKIADSRALEHKQTIIYFSTVSCVTRHTTQLFYYDSTISFQRTESYIIYWVKIGVKVYNGHNAKRLVFIGKQKISLKCLLSWIY